MSLIHFRMLILFTAIGISHLTSSLLAAEKSIVIDRESHKVEGKTTFEKSFTAQNNATEFALLFDLNLDKPSSGGYWNVYINDTLLGKLEAHIPQIDSNPEQDGFHRIGFAVPANVLKEGENKLSVSGRGQPAVLRNLVLDGRPLRQALQLEQVTVKVKTPEGKPVPARITVVNEQGQLSKLYNAQKPTTAVRPGILYTLGTGDSFELPPGKYTLYATRGMEWGVDRQPIVVESNKPLNQTLVISREVDTTGFIACDSHIHTLPGSGHGNATFEERMITIAGEGIEVAIATDHNHISDYSGYQNRTGTSKHFHSISGDEVTTHNGHFTAFPLDPEKAVPGGVKGRNPLFLKQENWGELIADMRTKGAEVVILNHPYWPSIPDGPFGRLHFNRSTGQRNAGPEFNFPGYEVVQPANKTPDFYYALEDWMSLLNRGLKLTAVGATDSHTVNSPVGQARTYLKSTTDDISQITPGEVCHAFTAGRAVASAGIFANLKLNRQFNMGDLVSAEALRNDSQNQHSKLKATLRVAAPSWVRPREVILYLNGKQVAQKNIDSEPNQPTDQTLEFSLELPPHDAYLVAFVLGDGITLPGWTTYGKASQAITNPIFLDLDGDSKYSAPRTTAKTLIANYQKQHEKLTPALQAELLDSTAVKADSAILLHVKDLLKPSTDQQP
ncbi:MAG: CehA/McbA family metallohydrolase [Planctomycetaceae bacterium]|nr:CehA/McbA family metallohydrolase [Planctomycetaceae bacterium]